MGDVAVMARRLPDKGIEYGWCGNGGYMKSTGRMLQFYNSPRQIEELFSMGELSHVGLPGSEYGGMPILWTTSAANRPLRRGDSERKMFSDIAFADYGYFYEHDREWYYIIPGPFRIKVPLDFIGNHVDDRGYEFTARSEIVQAVAAYIVEDFFREHTSFQEHIVRCKYDISEIKETILSDEWPLHTLFKKYQNVYAFFDDWVVIECDKDCKDITAIYVKEKEDSDKRTETCDWFSPCPKIHDDYDERLKYYKIMMNLDKKLPSSGKYLTSWDMLLSDLDCHGIYEKAYHDYLSRGNHDDAAHMYAVSFIYGMLESHEKIGQQLVKDNADAEQIKRMGYSASYIEKVKEELSMP